MKCPARAAPSLTDLSFAGVSTLNVSLSGNVIQLYEKCLEYGEIRVEVEEGRAV